ncbi:MAG: hypothetical protein FWE97_00010 [Dehalococcoidia bacterium]|nr:hypothetical protein [Dehalococcoidia bacterium]
MTPKVAEEYFAWFKDNIPNELANLNDAVGKPVVLDFSPDSLISLEKWFISVRKYVKLSKKQILEDFGNAPEYILQEMMQNRYAPTVGTADLGAKIAIYFGEIFTRNDSGLYWDYVKKPKSDVCFNEPVIYGFTPPNLKYKGYVSTFNWGIPLYSNSSKGTNWKGTWYEFYRIWENLKKLYWAPDYSVEKLMRQMNELPRM